MCVCVFVCVLIQTQDIAKNIIQILTNTWLFDLKQKKKGHFLSCSAVAGHLKAQIFFIFLVWANEPSSWQKH